MLMGGVRGGGWRRETAELGKMWWEGAQGGGWARHISHNREEGVPGLARGEEREEDNREAAHSHLRQTAREGQTKLEMGTQRGNLARMSGSACLSEGMCAACVCVCVCVLQRKRR